MDMKFCLKSYQLVNCSSKAVLDGSKAVRGGIPLVFPQFGPLPIASDMKPLKQHGFARTAVWTLHSTNNTTEAVLELNSSMIKCEEWPFAFKMLYKVSLEEDSVLRTEMTISNESSDSIDFHFLFHTYFACENVEHVEISSLTQTPLSIKQEIDCIYEAPKSGSLQIANAGEGKVKVLFSNSLADVVVWNPWREKAKAMSDLGEEQVFHSIMF